MRYCQRCGTEIINEEPHHIIPRKYGGEDNKENLIPLCFKCHDYVEIKTQEWIDKGIRFDIDILKSMILNDGFEEYLDAFIPKEERETMYSIDPTSKNHRKTYKFEDYLQDKELREPLPRNGIWTVEDLAAYLDTNPTQLMQKLTDNGIKVLHLGNRYKLKLVRLDDLGPK